MTASTALPEFDLATSGGGRLSSADLRGRRTVLYFYPKDDTPGCTAEACQFNDNLAAFERAQVPVLGISPDKADSHQKFRAKYGLRFGLLSDPDHKVMERYGAWGEKTMYGRTTTGVLRSTFLVDEKGKIARSWYNVKADGHAAKVLTEVGS